MLGGFMLNEVSMFVTELTEQGIRTDPDWKQNSTEPHPPPVCNCVTRQLYYSV